MTTGTTSRTTSRFSTALTTGVLALVMALGLASVSIGAVSITAPVTRWRLGVSDSFFPSAEVPRRCPSPRSPRTRPAG